jgi:hypothetical protein
MQIESVFAVAMLAVILGNMVTVGIVVSVTRLDRGRRDLGSFALFFGVCAVVLIVALAVSEARGGAQGIDGRGEKRERSVTDSLLDAPPG